METVGHCEPFQGWDVARVYRVLAFSACIEFSLCQLPTEEEVMLGPAGGWIQLSRLERVPAGSLCASRLPLQWAPALASPSWKQDGEVDMRTQWHRPALSGQLAKSCFPSLGPQSSLYATPSLASGLPRACQLTSWGPWLQGWLSHCHTQPLQRPDQDLSSHTVV